MPKTNVIYLIDVVFWPEIIGHRLCYLSVNFDDNGVTFRNVSEASSN